MQLLTIAAIAKRLDIPEATARYYRDRFEPWVPPAVGEGRDRRYTDETAEVLRFIADAMKANIPAESIRAGLADRFPTTQEAQPPATTTQQQAATALLDAVREVVHGLLIEQQQATALEVRALRSLLEDAANRDREQVERLAVELVETKADLARERAASAEQAARLADAEAKLAARPWWKWWV